MAVFRLGCHSRSSVLVNMEIGIRRRDNVGSPFARIDGFSAGARKFLGEFQSFRFKGHLLKGRTSQSFCPIHSLQDGGSSAFLVGVGVVCLGRLDRNIGSGRLIVYCQRVGNVLQGSSCDSCSNSVSWRRVARAGSALRWLTTVPDSCAA